MAHGEIAYLQPSKGSDNFFAIPEMEVMVLPLQIRRYRRSSVLRPRHLLHSRIEYQHRRQRDEREPPQEEMRNDEN